MTDQSTVYIERNPGDLITAEDWNALQRRIRDDIASTAAEAAGAITHVASSDDSGALDGMDLDQLTDEITKRVLEAVNRESGYRQVFRVLEESPSGGDPEFDIIEHNLGDCPLVDVYELQYFDVVSAEDDDIYKTIATFYLHHSSEERIRVTTDNGRETVDIQPISPTLIGIPFADMLARYHVEYSDSTSLGDLETEFWKAFFSAPNDKFDDAQYCHSPWYERCCREERDVASLKAKGDWDELRFQMRAWKLVNGPVADNDGIRYTGTPAPANVGVAHLDLNRVAVWLNGSALHTGEAARGDTDATGNTRAGLPDEFQHELKVMILLRV